MNAQQMLLDYASQKNDGKLYTNEQFLGKAMREGVCINRSGGTRTNVNIRREGKTIIVTETTIEPTLEGQSETTAEVLRVSL